MKKATLNHARIRSWNQPVLTVTNESSFLLKETTGAFDEARTHDWQVSTDHKSDVLATALRQGIIQKNALGKNSEV